MDLLIEKPKRSLINTIFRIIEIYLLIRISPLIEKMYCVFFTDQNIFALCSQFYGSN